MTGKNRRKGLGDWAFMLGMLFIAIICIVGFAGYKVYNDDTSRNRVKRMIDKKFAEEKTIEGEVSTVTLTPDRTSVTFSDQRAKEFKGVCPKPVPIGKYVVFTYNQDDQIMDLTAK